MSPNHPIPSPTVLAKNTPPSASPVDVLLTRLHRRNPKTKGAFGGKSRRNRQKKSGQ